MQKTNSFFRKNVIFFSVVGCFVIAEALLFLFYGNGLTQIKSYFVKQNPVPNGILLFEGEKCLSCTKVETFIKNNAVESKVAFTRLEVFGNEFNADMLADKAQTCGLDPAQIGVPFLWDGKNCVLGYLDVIKFFQQKIVKNP